MQKLVIDRSKWLRGEGNEKSFLLRHDDNKMCCVGIYMQSRGFKPRELRNNGAVIDVEAAVKNPEVRFKRAKCEWLTAHSNMCDLYSINDEESLPETERESMIASGFAKYGVKVTFVDKVKRTVKRVVKKARRKVKS